MSASRFIFLGLIAVAGIVDSVPQWKCKKYDIGNGNSKIVMFLNYADCVLQAESCSMNVTMLSNIANVLRDYSHFVLYVEEDVEIQSFKRKNRVGQHLLVKHFSNSTGLHVNKSVFGSSGVLLFDKFSTLAFKLPFTFQFQKKNNFSRILSLKNYNAILKASIFATSFDDICNNEEDRSSTESDIDYFETTQSDVINTKSQIPQKTIIDIFEMQKEDSGEKFREALRKQKEDQLNIEQTEEDQKFNIPIRVIIPVEHIHLENEIPKEDKYLKYNYLVLKEDIPEYHGHLENDIPDTLIKEDYTSEHYKTEDGFLKYEVLQDLKAYTNKILELKPVYEYESITPAPKKSEEYESSEKEEDILSDMIRFIPRSLDLGF